MLVYKLDFLILILENTIIMAIINCKECGKEISDKAKFCPNCGYEIESFSKSLDQAGQKMQKLGCMLTIFVTIPILLMLLMFGC